MKKSSLLFVLLVAAGVPVAMAGGNDQSLALKRAMDHVKMQKAAIRVADDDAFAYADAVIDEKGRQHVRLTRTHKGLPVIGGDVVVHSDSNGRFAGASLTLPAPLKINMGAAVSEENAILTAQRSVSGLYSGEPGSRLVVYARNAHPVLAYDVQLEGAKADGTPSDLHVIVSAADGQLLDQWDDIHTSAAAAIGRTQYSGNVGLTSDLSSGYYYLRDPARGNNYTTDMNNSQMKRSTGTIFRNTVAEFGDNTTANRATAGADAQFGVQTTWDFYLNRFNRSGIANDGAGALSRVHYGTNYANAFWSDSCFCMTYGDGDGRTFSALTSLDVAGHEMTHGVTSRTAALIYSGESGGLNEATSDVMGTMVEFYANSTSDTGDYLIGEMIYISNPDQSKALRYMYKPSLDGKSPDCWSASVGNLDVHYSSGIGNRAFYFMAEGVTSLSGASCNGSTFAGIGKEKASAVWYKALTQYMTSNTNYAGARTATLNAASDLYGSGSVEYNAVAAAWSGVNVN